MVVKIERDHVLNGGPANSKYCVLACAFRDAGCLDISVDEEITRIDDKNYFNTPTMNQIIREYDQLEDFMAEAEPPDEVVEKWVEEKNAGLSEEERYEGGEFSGADFMYSNTYTAWAQEEYTRELEKFADKWAGTEINVGRLILVPKEEEESYNEDQD